LAAGCYTKNLATAWKNALSDSGGCSTSTTPGSCAYAS